MIEHVVRELWNNKIEQRCYNKHEFGCCINHVLCFSCSNRYANNPKLYTICWNMIEQYTVIFPILFYHVNNVVTWEKPALLSGLAHLAKSPRIRGVATGGVRGMSHPPPPMLSLSANGDRCRQISVRDLVERKCPIGRRDTFIFRVV